MRYIEGQNRNQLVIFPTSLNDAIDPDNDVRFIDLFVESLDLEDMGFKVDHVEDGRPAYHPQDLLKLYLYGYLNSIRSSRKLEKETRRNIEVIPLQYSDFVRDIYFSKSNHLNLKSTLKSNNQGAFGLIPCDANF